MMAWLAGKTVGDIVLEQWEIDAMLAGMLSPDNPPTGHTKLSDWLIENRETLGRTYYSELARNYGRG